MPERSHTPRVAAAPPASTPSLTAPASTPLSRRAGWLLLLAVTVAHLLAANRFMADRFGWGADDSVKNKSIARMDVAFVRELAQAAPPATPAAAAVPPARAALPAVAQAVKAAQAASAPASAKAASAPEPAKPAEADPALAVVTPAPAASEVPHGPDVAANASAPAHAVAAAASASASASASPSAPVVAALPASPASTPAAMPPQAPTSTEAFSWPPSTRLSYNLTGHYRGPVQGDATVEWLRSGSRYQVRLVANAGLLLTRTTTSEGELTDHGLAPRRFEGQQKVVFGSAKGWTQQFDAQRIVLANGSQIDAPPGAQDEASQFVQLTWLFTTQPQMLRVGQAVDIPLAVKSRLSVWSYEVKDQKTLDLPFGRVDTFHVKPRRDGQGGDMTAEIWIAPSLQNLPVRILIRQDEANFVDLTLTKPPMQAAPR